MLIHRELYDCPVADQSTAPWTRPRRIVLVECGHPHVIAPCRRSRICTYARLNTSSTCDSRLNTSCTYDSRLTPPILRDSSYSRNAYGRGQSPRASFYRHSSSNNQHIWKNQLDCAEV